MVSRRDVATRAGVSEATVSRVLNGLDVVKPDTQRRVLDAAEALGYRPSAIARSFARGRSGNIGVVLPLYPNVRPFSSYYFSEICSGLGLGLARHGYNMLILFTHEGETTGLEDAVESRKVDGCILLGNVASESQFQEWLERNIPFCLVGQRHDDPSIAWVDADHVKGAWMATTHLLRKGHRRIGFLNGPLSYSNSRDRLEGYRQALTEHDVGFDPELMVYGNYSRSSGVRAVESFLRMKPVPSAIFAANDRMAAGLVASLREAGLHPGDDTAIVGYDDGDIATLTHPPLTTVRVPFFDIGDQAAELLIQQMDDPTRNRQHRVLPTEFVIRSSCGGSVRS